jgi:hypothetical protein
VRGAGLKLRSPFLLIRFLAHLHCLVMISLLTWEANEPGREKNPSDVRRFDPRFRFLG